MEYNYFILNTIIEICLPETVILADEVAVPKQLVALIVYSPESSAFTVRISRAANPKSNMVR